MRKLFLPMLLLPMMAFSQVGTGYVGINTDSPQGTLDVKGMPNDATKFDGIIAPRLTGQQLSAKSYTALQTGSIVYVTAVPPSLTGQVANITNRGYYYFDGQVWKSFLNDYDFSGFLTTQGTKPDNPLQGSLETMDPNYSRDFRVNPGYYSQTMEGEVSGFTVLNTFEESIPVMYRYKESSDTESYIMVESTAIQIKGKLVGDTQNPAALNDYVQKHYVDSRAVPAPPARGTYVLKSINGVMSWQPSN